MVSGTKWAGRPKVAHGLASVTFALGADQVLGVGDADDVVDVPGVDGEPGESGFDGHAQGLGHRQISVQGPHVGPGHHDLAHDGVAELDDRMDQLAFVALDHILLQGDVGHGQKLRFAHSDPLGPRAEEHVGQADQPA